MEIALEVGADDIKPLEESFEVTCPVEVYSDLLAAMEAAGIEPEVKQITRIPDNTIDLDTATGRKVLKLMDRLDEHEDVQNVSANFNIPDEAMAEIAGE